MQQDYLESWKDAFNQLQKPFQEMMVLNVKTLQNLAYLKPDELADLQKAEDLLAKNINIFIQNGHRTLNYMQQAFQIIEKHLLAATNNNAKQRDSRH